MPEPSHHTFKVHGPLPARASAPAEQPIYEISVENSRRLDRRCTDDYAIPQIILMENAALGLAAHAAEMLAHTRGQSRIASVLVAAGPGNNAGDGLACARHLHNQSIPVRVVLTRNPGDYKGDAKTNLDIITRMALPIVSVDEFLAAPPIGPPALIIDALFGTGLSRPVEGHAASLINWINHTRAKHAGAVQVLAADIPSGLDATTGQPLSEAVVRADRTVAFAALKPGMSAVEAQPFLGETHIAPIGAPRQLLDELATRITPPSDPTRA